MGKEIVAIRKTVPPYQNLIKPEDGFVTATGAIVRNSPYDSGMTVSSSGNMYIKKSVKSNTTYTFQAEHNGEIGVYNSDASAAILTYSTSGIITFNSGANTEVRIYIQAISANGYPYDYYIKKYILLEGSYASLDFTSSENRIVERLKDAGTIEELRVRFYPGVERTLKVRPYILHKSDKSEEFFTYPEGTEPYITGDDDYLVFPVYLNFDYDDELIVWYENEGTYAYSLVVDIVVNYGREVI